jgi:type II secretory pathway pseudopilin PulG
MAFSRSTRQCAAYTLVEVLVASIVVSVVTGLSSVVVMNLTRSQLDQRQQRTVAEQVRLAMQVMEEDILAADRQPDSLSTFQLRTASNTPVTYDEILSQQLGLGLSENDDALVVKVPLRDKFGVPTGAYEYRLYCAELQAQNGLVYGKRLARYIFASLPMLPINTAALQCSPAGIALSFSRPEPTPEYLTDGTILIRNLRFWQVWAGNDPGTQYTAGVFVPGVMMEVGAHYYAGNTDPSRAGVRVSSINQSPLVYRKSINRRFSF